MDFKERLSALRITQGRPSKEGLELRRIEEEKKRREEERLRESKIKKAEELGEIVEEKLKPVFESVNDVYLAGRGGISTDTTASEIKSDRSKEPQAHLELEWDVSKSGGGHEGETGVWTGESLSVYLDQNQLVKLQGAGESSPIVEINLEDKNWRQQFEDGIYLILSTPGACSWRNEFIEGHAGW